MTEEKIVHLVILDELSKLPPQDQTKINVAADMIRKLLKVFGPQGAFALALVGAELAADEEE